MVTNRDPSSYTRRCFVVCVISLAVMCFCCLLCFFFQAEDGIRDLVRSRGLGDVYKRQPSKNALDFLEAPGRASSFFNEKIARFFVPKEGRPVSYTHLTLPTSDLV